MEINLSETDKHGFGAKLKNGRLLLARKFIGDMRNTEMLVTIQCSNSESLKKLSSNIYIYEDYSYVIQRDDNGFLVLEVL